MNIENAIKESCDVFFYELSKKIGIDKIAKLAKKFGCDEVINYNKENFKDRVLELTNNVGLPVVYDGVGKNTLEDSLGWLR